MSAEVPRKERRLGRYLLRRPLGKGGSGQVFLAWRTNPTDEPLVCVVKFPLQRYAVDKLGRRRFLQEARLAARLGCHPNIVHVFDVDYHRRMPYLVMEYVDGTDLNNLLKRMRRWGRVLSTPSIHNILAGAAAGLHHAHSGATIDKESVSIVHRDITPSNILVTRDGIVKLADFGIGVAMADGTTGNHWRGTARYMSPEHLNCTPCPEMDIYALGVVAWEMVENRVFREELEGPLHYPAIIEGKIPQMQRADRRLAGVIRSCLDSDPRQRPTAAELIEALARCPGYSRDPSVLEHELVPIVGTQRSSGASQDYVAATPELVATLAALDCEEAEGDEDGEDNDEDGDGNGSQPLTDLPAGVDEASGAGAPQAREKDAPQVFLKRMPDPGSGNAVQQRVSVVCHPAASPEPEVSSSQTTKEERAEPVSTSATTRGERRDKGGESGSGDGPGSGGGRDPESGPDSPGEPKSERERNPEPERDPESERDAETERDHEPTRNHEPGAADEPDFGSPAPRTTADGLAASKPRRARGPGGYLSSAPLVVIALATSLLGACVTLAVVYWSGAAGGQTGAAASRVNGVEITTRDRREQ